MTCQIVHGCAGFHDMGALAVAAEFAAIDGDAHDAQFAVDRFDRLSADGVPSTDDDFRALVPVRKWLGEMARGRSSMAGVSTS